MQLSERQDGRPARVAALDEIVVARCRDRLAELGMRPSASALLPGVLEVRLSSRFTGWVGVSAKSQWDGPDSPVQVSVRVAVRDEEITRLTTTLRGLVPDDQGARARSLVSKELTALAAERGLPPQEWTARTEAEAEPVARQVWRLLWPHEGAVAHMMHGDVAEATRMLATIARPVSQNPTTWSDADRPTAAFFYSFAAHFGVDLGIELWPAKAS